MKNNLFKQICSEDKLFHDEQENAYSYVKLDDYYEVMPIESKQYRYLIERRLYKANLSFSTNEIENIVTTARLKALHDKPERKLHIRVAEHKGDFYYDLGNGHVVKTTTNGWCIGQTSKVLFQHFKTQTLQTYPTRNGDINLLNKYMSNVLPSERLLLLVHIVIAFIPNIVHAPLLIQSEKGSGKSTLAKMMKQIIDPCVSLALILGKDPESLMLNLQGHYFANFDNVSKLSSDISDYFCAAITGVSMERRKRYTDNERVTTKIANSCISFNGIDFGALKEDLLDRSLLIKLERQNMKKLPDTEIWEQFTADLPFILGGIFDTIVEAKKLFNSSCPKSKFRLEDYNNWGYAIASVLGKGEQYITVLDDNHMSKHLTLINANALCQAIMEFMSDKPRWKGQPRALLTYLDQIAIDKRLGKNTQLWPKSAIELSFQLKKYKAILSETGIFVEWGNRTNKGSTIIISKQ